MKLFLLVLAIAAAAFGKYTFLAPYYSIHFTDENIWDIVKNHLYSFSFDFHFFPHHMELEYLLQFGFLALCLDTNLFMVCQHFSFIRSFCTQNFIIFYFIVYIKNIHFCFSCYIHFVKFSRLGLFTKGYFLYYLY